MAPVTKIFAARAVEAHGHAHAGVFTWEVDADLFYADDAIARLFEVDPHEAEKGLPLLTFLDRIHPDDRARAAKSIHDTIISGGPCQQEYRIISRKGPSVSVMALGRCFKGRNGGSTHYAGMIHPIPQRHSTKSAIRAHLQEAHALAVQHGEATVATQVARVLEEFDQGSPAGRVS